ncbi:MAG: 4-alpha-glucanotransferase [Chlamydiales bacterium]|nr:4-alpha-glucanotransferase [Chlamydiales bacterium]
MESKLYKTQAAPQWKKIGVKNHHGICLPLSALHSKNSCGIGEYLDLIPLVSWCTEIGFDVIQLLPINDTGLGVSPYDSLSAYALNPLFLSLSALPELGYIPNYEEKIAKVRYWNRTPRVKFHIVRELKNVFFKEYIPTVFPIISQTFEYKKFVQEQASWLEPYALFKAIKEKNYWKSWEDWPGPYKTPTKEMYRELLETHKDSCDFHKLLQFLCFLQFEKVKKIATEKKVFLKGDIPILISQDSADVWYHRHLFWLHLSAGAPPDMYTRDGQHWGFPLYDWDEIEKEKYKWWKERLELASHLYHLYRIDHVVGFFRMWGIAQGRLPKDGSFFPPEEHKWLPHGKKIMEMMLKSAPILPIGEDLGLVPKTVKQTLYDLGICGTKMMRWERQYKTDGSFIPPSEYEPMTMTTVSTHDSDTLQLWWRHFPKEAKLFSEFKGWDYKPFLTLERHKEILYDSHHSASLFHINLLQEYLALFPDMISTNLADERINIPGKVLDTNWTYRFRPSVEEIIENALLKETMKELIPHI